MPNNTQFTAQAIKFLNTEPFNLRRFLRVLPETSMTLGVPASRAEQIMGLADLAEHGFTLEEFSMVVGHAVVQYSDLPINEAEAVLRALGGPAWREAL
jgi:threonine synthase